MRIRTIIDVNIVIAVKIPKINPTKTIVLKLKLKAIFLNIFSLNLYLWVL